MPSILASFARRAKRSPSNSNATPREVALLKNRQEGLARTLVELDVFDLHEVLLVLFGNRADHGALLGLGADVLVVLLRAGVIEVVGDRLVAVLDLDHRRAGLGLFQITLGAGDRALEGLLLVSRV